MKADFKSISSGIMFDQSMCMYPSRLVGRVGGEQTFA
jgi:hypothetical protein